MASFLDPAWPRCLNLQYLYWPQHSKWPEIMAAGERLLIAIQAKKQRVQNSHRGMSHQALQNLENNSSFSRATKRTDKTRFQRSWTPSLSSPASTVNGESYNKSFNDNIDSATELHGICSPLLKDMLCGSLISGRSGKPLLVFGQQCTLGKK